MSAGHPQYGGTNSVQLLDLGQPGGTRQLAGQATFFVKTRREEMTPRIVTHRMAQNAGAFEDHLGVTGERIVWEGTIVATSIANMNAILDDLNQATSGYSRDTAGKLSVFHPLAVRETRMTDFDGTVLADRARIQAWKPIGPRTFSGAKVIQQVEVAFEVLL